MTVRSLFFVLALATGATWAPPLRAGIYESYHCHCTAKPGETCSCSYDYTLGKAATKEFRGYCDLHAWYLEVSGRDKNTTCTLPARAPIGGYISKSCTNWSPFSTDHISVKVTCKNLN